MKYILMEDSTIYLIVSCSMLVITELLPFLPIRSQGLIHALTVVAQESYEEYKIRKESQPK